MFYEILNRGIFSSEGGEYFYINKYLPKRVKKNPGSFQDEYFKLIIRYKKGDANAIIMFAKLLNIIISNHFRFYDLILPIPPSSSYLDIYPNAIVCSYLNSALGIKYLKGVIVCERGHKPGHIYGRGRGRDVSGSFSVKGRKALESKNIILFDDIITTGRTFRTIKHEILKKGAGSVTGLFLGKTSMEQKKDDGGL